MAYHFARAGSPSRFFNFQLSICNILRLPTVRCLAFPISALSICIILSSCEFRSRRPAYRFDPGVTFKIRYSAETRAKADGSWGSAPYVSAATAEFTGKAVTDSAKGQIELTLSVDTLDFRAAERGAEEDAYMDGRLKKYRSRLALSRTGQLLGLEEEPSQPPVEFSPLNIGRWLVYALPAFPDAAIRQGARWESTQPLLDKFHPDSRVVKHFTLSAIRETPEGDLATCLVEMEIFLAEDFGDTTSTAAPALSGSGRVVFNLAKGRPVSAEIELEGRFLGNPGRAPSDTTNTGSGNPAGLPLKLQEKLELSFSD